MYRRDDREETRRVTLPFCILRSVRTPRMSLSSPSLKPLSWMVESMPGSCVEKATTKNQRCKPCEDCEDDVSVLKVYPRATPTTKAVTRATGFAF